MIQQKDILADLHTHTTFSLHGYSTIKENIDVAIERKLKYIAITDHYYDMGAITNNEIERKNEHSRIAYLRQAISPNVGDICVLGGAEFNFGQDIPSGKDYWDKIKNIDWKPIGLHTWHIDIKQTSLNELQEIITLDIENKSFTTFAHIERELDKIDNKKYGENLTIEIKNFLEYMVELAIKKNLYLEVNEQSLIRDECGSVKRLEYWLNIAKENDARICLGTDAHYCGAIGKFDKTIELINKVNYPIDLILNCNKKDLKEMFET